MDSFADCLSAQHSGNVSRKRKKARETQEQITYANQQQIELQNQVNSMINAKPYLFY